MNGDAAAAGSPPVATMLPLGAVGFGTGSPAALAARGGVVGRFVGVFAGLERVYARSRPN